MGFNNHGAAAAAERLKKRRATVVGANIGRSKLTPNEGAVADYVTSTEALAPYADYMVINVSSPNTPSLRELQAVEQLRPLISGVQQALRRAAAGRAVPLLLKVAPDRPARRGSRRHRRPGTRARHRRHHRHQYDDRPHRLDDAGR
jgi:dihydroorotate dehydrogenase